MTDFNSIDLDGLEDILSARAYKKKKPWRFPFSTIEDILSARAYKKKKPWRFPFSTTFYKFLACNLTSAYGSKFYYATPIKTRKSWKPG